MSTARAVAALDCDFVALTITPSEEPFVSPIKVPDYLQWLSGVEVVLQAHHLTSEQAVKIAGLLNVQHVEIPAKEDFSTDSKVHLWACRTKPEHDAHGAYAIVDTVLDDVDGNVFRRVKDTPSQGVKSSYDIDVQDFEGPEGIDFDAIELLIDKLRKGK